MIFRSEVSVIPSRLSLARSLLTMSSASLAGEFTSLGAERQTGPAQTSSKRPDCELTHFRLTFCLIFFFRFSFVTSSSFSSRSAYQFGGSLILTLIHS